MKSITYQGKKLSLTPIRLLCGGPVAAAIAGGSQAFVSDDDSVLLIKDKKVTHLFAPGTPNRNELSYEALA